MNNVETLASKILYHKKLYYSGRAIISDEEYDKLEEELRKLSPEHPVLSMVGYPLDTKKRKVVYKIPMLSLAKTYSVEELQSFIKNYTSVVCIDKIDGMALCLRYNSKGNLIVAATRGNGQQGEDVTEYAYHINSIPKKIQIPELISKDEETIIEIRGEVFFYKDVFPHFEDMFDSYRNAVSGTFNRKNVEEVIKVLNTLGFCAYDIHISNDNIVFTTYIEKLCFLSKMGFYTGLNEGMVSIVYHNTFKDTNTLSNWISEKFNRERNYLIDGLVFRINDEHTWKSLGCTSHHPKGSLAFKQTNETTITKILDIEYNIGRSGKVSFRARLEPVLLSGAKITYATLHNAEYIISNNYSIGAKVRIKRSGEVIPAIIECIEPAEEPYTLPTHCKCGSKLIKKNNDLFCLNQECMYKNHEDIIHFVSTLNIENIGESTILRLKNAGLINTHADLFRIKEEDLLNLDRFSYKSASNFVEAINKAKKVKLWEFLAALGLSRGGIVKCKEIAKIYKTLDKVRSLTIEELASNKGWNKKSAGDFIKSLQTKSKIIDELLEFMTVEDEDTTSVKKCSLTGKNICITGELSQPRDYYKSLLESVGAKFVNSVSTKTDYLVCNNESNSTKYKSAVALKIPIINEEELLKLLKE